MANTINTLKARIKAAEARVNEYRREGNLFAATAALRAMAAAQGQLNDVLSGNVREPFEVTRTSR